MARLIAACLEAGALETRSYHRNRFAQRYTVADIARWRKWLKPMRNVSGRATRKSRSYREKRLRYQKTRPFQIGIGERRRPDPQGQPGYLRVDTVHQGRSGWVLEAIS